jgi:hypothetical protein
MITDADRVKYAPPPKPQKKATLVERADSMVDIRDILKEMHLWAPSGDYYSYKIYCPWHDEHADQNDKNCRIFGGTNIYCWAMHGYITPSYLYSRWKHMPREKAAEQLLDQRGLLNKPWREKWNDLIDAREDSQHKRLGSKNDFITALHITLARHPEYVTHEFHSDVRARWQLILKALDKIWEDPSVDLEILNEVFNVSLTALTKVAKIVDSKLEGIPEYE